MWSERVLRPAVVSLVLVSVASCAETSPTAPSAVTSPTPPDHWPEPTAAAVGGLTTDGEVARHNLDARIDGLEQALTRLPGSLDLHTALVDALLTRTTFFGTWSDFDRALDLADSAVLRAPDAPGAHTLRAQVFNALHRFDEATSAATLAGDYAPALGVLDTIRLARGEDLSEVLTSRQAAVDAFPSYASWTRLAPVLAALGRFDEADAAYRAAIAAYRDVSPFAHAWVAFQRGVMWAEVAGWPARAVPLYREAARRLPSYVVATVHLAELEWQYGLTEQAIQRLRAVLPRTDDAEPGGLLGEILLASGEPAHAGEAHELIDAARVRYEQLLGSHPLAFLDHGSEFFAGPGADAARAVAMARANLENRRNERAYQVAIEAALAHGDSAAACAFAAEAPKHPVSTPLAELLTAACP